MSLEKGNKVEKVSKSKDHTAMEEQANVKTKSTFREYAEAIGMALLLALFIRTFIVQAFKIPSGSMIPTLQIGDHILVNKLAYGVRMPFLERYLVEYTTPQRGDVVVFIFPEDRSKDFIKRVIGLPGDMVEVHDGRVRVNGRDLDEAYLDQQLNMSHSSKPPTYVKPGYYFVMGDNRDNSSDSRIWGLVPKKYVYGKALFRYWPLSSATVITRDSHNTSIPPPRDGAPEMDER